MSPISTAGPLIPALAADLAEFEDWMVGCNFSPNTIHKRKLVIENTLEQWQTWQVRPSQIATWLQGYSGWTASTYFGHARCAFAWALETGRIEVDPMARLKAPPSPDPVPRPLPPEVMHQALSTAAGDVRAFLLLAYLAGLRAHEVAKVRSEDLTPDTLAVVGKSRRAARLPMHPDLWALAQTMPREGWWFPSPTTNTHITPGWVTRAIARHLRGLGVTTGSIHRVRASYATDLLCGGVNVRVVQDLMRHRSLASTEHYLGVAENEKRDAIAGLRIA